MMMMIGDLTCKRDALTELSALALSASKTATAKTATDSSAIVSALGHELEKVIAGRAESDPGSDTELLFTGKMTKEQVLTRLQALQSRVLQTAAA
jgi:hypothetical protein